MGTETRRRSLRRMLVDVSCDLAARVGSIEEIEPDEWAAEPGQYVLIDVRPEAERAVSIIPGALTIEEFESRYLQQSQDQAGTNPEPVGGNYQPPSIQQTSPIPVAYCTAGFRSGQYAKRLNRQGHVCLNLKGGLLSWCEQGLPLCKPEGESTVDVHVYAKIWNLVPAPYRGVW